MNAEGLMKYLSGLLQIALFLMPGNQTFGTDGNPIFAPGGVIWQPKSRITVGKEVKLMAPAHWSAEEIVINSAIYTNGFPLDFMLAKWCGNQVQKYLHLIILRQA